jgi:hypothetical protein
VTTGETAGFARRSATWIRQVLEIVAGKTWDATEIESEVGFLLAWSEISKSSIIRQHQFSTAPGPVFAC